MFVIFIRHGESELNKADRHQFPNTNLSKQGIKQVNLLANRLVGTKITCIVSSKYKRAIQTAEVLRKKLHKKVIYIDLFNEKRPPSDILGIEHGSAIAEKYLEAAKSHIDDPEWHYSDEENHLDVNKRARRAIEYLIGMKKDSVIVVSHAALIRTIIAIGVLGDGINRENFFRFYDAFDIENTGITECEISADGRLKVLTFNDYLHLK